MFPKFLTICMMMLALLPLRSAELVSEERQALPIIVPEDAAASTKTAAQELVGLIEEISGVKPELIATIPKDKPAAAIWIGYHDALKELFPETDFSFQHPEETLIVSKGGNVAIVGRDRRVAGVEQESGTTNAIYAFAKKHLGVRWLWPGSLGRDVPAKQTLSLAEFEDRHHPVFVQRDIFRNLNKGGYSRLTEWCIRQGLFYDSFDYPSSHAFADWWDRYGKERPEYFALQPDGTRGTYPENPRRKKLCDGEPAVWKQWLANAEEMLKENPALRVFNASPNDSSNSGICVDPRSTAWDHPGASRWNYDWADRSAQGPVMSNRYVTFANTLGRMLKEKHPDKDYYVCLLAYGPSKPAPIELAIDKNIAIGYAGTFPLLDKHRRDLEKAEFAAWGKLTPNLFFRPNITLYTGGFHALPAVSFRNVTEDYRFIAENGCRGLIFDTLLDHWSTQGPMYYLMAELAWDPMQDGEAVLTDYFQRGFGPAAATVREYFELMEKAHEAVFNRPDWMPSGRMYKQLSERRMLEEAWSPEVLAQARTLLDRAAAQVAEDEKFSRRVAFITKGFDFSENLIDTMRLMNRVRESGGKDYEALEEAEALISWRDAFLASENKSAKANDAIPPINPHRFNNTFIKARKVEDYLGPISKAFAEAAKAEKANPTLSTRPVKEPAGRTASGLEIRWTGKTGDGLWATPANWEVRTPSGWQLASSAPSAESTIILDDNAPAALRTINLNAPTSAKRIIIAGTEKEPPFIIQSVSTADIANEDSDSGMIYPLTLLGGTPLEQQYGTASPLSIRTHLRLTGDPKPVVLLASRLHATIELTADVTPPDLVQKRSGAGNGVLIMTNDNR